MRVLLAGGGVARARIILSLLCLNGHLCQLAAWRKVTSVYLDVDVNSSSSNRFFHIARLYVYNVQRTREGAIHDG